MLKDGEAVPTDISGVVIPVMLKVIKQCTWDAVSRRLVRGRLHSRNPHGK